MAYRAVYYRDSAGREPVRDFRAGLSAMCRDKLDWPIRLCNQLSDGHPHLPHPYSSGLKGRHYRELRELNADCATTHYRILYARSGRFLVLLHAFDKRSRAISEADKEIALERWLDFKARMDAVPTARPRAMGHDAP